MCNLFKFLLRIFMMDWIFGLNDNFNIWRFGRVFVMLKILYVSLLCVRFRYFRLLRLLNIFVKIIFNLELESERDFKF